jgi:hypothetical protein
MPTLDELHKMSRRELTAVMRDGHAIEEDALADSVYRGTSLGLGQLIESLTWRTFAKVFHRDPAFDVLRGWNVRCHEDEALRYRTDKRGKPRTFGHYQVHHHTPRGRAPGLVLDYAAPGNFILDPTRWLQDPVVAVNVGDSTLLLGCMFLCIGPIRLQLPGFFTLQLNGVLDHSVPV